MKIAVVVPLGVTFFRTSYHFGVGLSYQTELMGFIPVPNSLVIARPVEEISLRKCTTFSSPYSSQEEVAQTGQFFNLGLFPGSTSSKGRRHKKKDRWW